MLAVCLCVWVDLVFGFVLIQCFVAEFIWGVPFFWLLVFGFGFWISGCIVVCNRCSG